MMEKTWKELFDDLPFDELATVMITPKAAAEISAINRENGRPFHDETIQKYADLMIAGAWRLEKDEPLIIHPISYEPIDGRMRLAAQVRAGLAIRYYIRKAKS